LVIFDSDKPTPKHQQQQNTALQHASNTLRIAQ